MAAPTRIYSLQNCIITFAGAAFSEFAEGDALTLTPDGPVFEKVRGADGVASRYTTGITGASGSLRLMQTAAFNDFMSGVLQADIAAPGGAGVGTFHLQDLNGTTVVSAAQAWITSWPDFTIAQAPVAREWPITLEGINWYVGGNI